MPFVKGEVFALILGSPFADVILWNVIHQIKKLYLEEKQVECLAVQTRAQSN